MPPKTATGRARGTGTRGRGGRGRGGAAAATAADSMPTDQPMTDATPSQTSTPAPVAQMTAAPVANIAPEPTASSSTADAAPVPAPVKRVASVRRGGASASPAPSASRGKKPIVPAPKAVRRSKEDREALQKEANAKKAEEARAALRDAKRAGRGRGDRGRGRGGGKARGGFMGDSERTIRDVVASGPFSAGQVSADAGFRGQRRAVGGGGFGGGGGGGGGYSGGSGGGGGGSSGTSRIKSEGGPSYGNVNIEDGGYISSDLDEADEGPRKDIDFINLLSDDEQDTAATNAGMAPIRVNRVEHREREKPVAADASKSKAAIAEQASNTTAIASPTSTKERTASPELVRGKQPRAKDVQVVRSERKWKGAWEDSSDDEHAAIKPEPLDDDTNTSITAAALPDSTHPPIKESASPESRRKSKGKGIARKHALPTEAPALQTVEERREWERHHLDLEILRQELGEITLPSSVPAAPAKDAQGDTKMSEGDAATATEETDLAEGVDASTSLPATSTNPPPDRRTDRVYLFQFPPILPSLVPATVKPEPVSPTLSKKIPASTAATAIDVDASAAPKAKAKQEVPESAGQMHSPFPSGLVGKLRVHASGRTTLDWGGTSLQVGMGTDVQFLQDALVAKFNDKSDVEGAKGKEEEQDEGAFGGEVMGLGQVRGKFVVTPDWEEIVGVRI
ncbi:hypothetical protein E4T48_00342 [Aureobasidium sp. EXF-10727]|nr:hypothetical protein E4T48_00342 [Aureobasidium sp. EXF-10727]